MAEDRCTLCGKVIEEVSLRKKKAAHGKAIPTRRAPNSRIRNGGRATLTVHRGATRVTRKALATIEPPLATEIWRPIKHAVVIRCPCTARAVP